MIQDNTILNVADNTGAKKVKCIKILGGSKKKHGIIGDKIIVSIKSLISQKDKKVKKGEVCHAIIVRTKGQMLRKDGHIIKFYENSVVLLDKQNDIIGTRIFGLIPREIKNLGYNKIISLAKEVL